jgi:N-acetylglucosamine-6-phosphate deacetylase
MDSAATLLQCVNNLIQWTGISAARALKSVTHTPARLLDCAKTKGSLHSGADADVVVFSWEVVDRHKELTVDQVWKFGVKVFDREDTN